MYSEQMSQWTQDQVLALAPDASATGPARELSSEAKWVSAGTNANAAWGEAKGSGQKPYQTAIDLREVAFKCSCPSRKIPCKHSLGLFLRLAKGELPTETPPAWVTEWLDRRAERVERPEKKELEAKPVTAEAGKRADKRWQNILNGIEELEVFLIDVVDQGLLAMQATRTWDQMAARMIDAQAPGLARRVREIGNKIGVGAEWAVTVTRLIGNIALLCEAAKRIDSLAEPMRVDIRTALGISFRKEDLGAAEESDIWDVVGQCTEQELKVTICRTWLRSRTLNVWRIHLAFSAGLQPFDLVLPSGVGLAIRGRTFPSNCPFRLQVDEHEVIPFQAEATGTIQEALEYAAEVWSANPWVDVTPMFLSQAQLSKDGGVWSVIDSEKRAVPLGRQDPLSLLARNGNVPSTLFGEWNGSEFRLCGAWGTWGYFKP